MTPIDSSPITSVLTIQKQASLTTYDGVTDFAGTSGRTFLGETKESNTTYNAVVKDAYKTSSNETFDMDVDASSTSEITGSSYLASSITIDASAKACVTYTYEEDEIICPDDEYEINCVPGRVDFTQCNARIDEEAITTFDPDTMQGYTCTVTALDSEHMYGQYDLSVQADDGTNVGVYDEISRIWINPIISLGIDGDISFDEVRPGTASYTQVQVENNAEGGVLLDMFITGKNWPAVAPNARCLDPYTNNLENYLSLGAFRYYSENGAYSTRNDQEIDTGYGLVVRNKDNEGYMNINYQMETGFTTKMFHDAEIIQASYLTPGWRANILSPGASMDLTFRLMLPEPCYGDFESASEGSIFIWAEAI